MIRTYSHTFQARLMLAGLILLSAACCVAASDDPLLSPIQGTTETVTTSAPDYNFPLVDPDHKRMQALLENAFLYVAPENGIVDPVSGYTVEGWNQDPERGLFLRSFTQLTAIGEWIELLADIAAGYADNPHISRREAFDHLAFVIESVAHDQHDPKVSAKGLMGNFLGLNPDGRVGPLARDVIRQDLVDEFGKETSDAIWEALKENEWISPENEDQSGVILRGMEYGLEHFDGPMIPFADDETRHRLMEIMDQRIVMVAYGDNANLSASIAKAIGALLYTEIRDEPGVAKLRDQMEQILEDQGEGYEFLYDESAGMLSFGWNASTDRYFGWETLEGKWIIGHSDYLVNEFRGPTQFVLLRYDMPEEIVANLGFKIRPYTMQDGRVLHAPSPWEGSAFQALGLSLSMLEMQYPAWRKILTDVVDIELDYAAREGLPGFLSESYIGEETAYEGCVGLPEITVSSRPRITDAPSLYTLGTAYSINPDGVEQLLDENWDVISSLMTDHGPWEGYNTTKGEAIEFQTSAHTLSFMLGAIGASSENMQRYLDAKGLLTGLDELYRSGKAIDFFAPETNIAVWSPDGSDVLSSREANQLHIAGEDLGETGVTFVLPGESGVNLSGGVLTIAYTAAHPIERAVITLDKKNPALQEAGVIPIDIRTSFPATELEQEISIPLPATIGLDGIKEFVMIVGNNRARAPLDISFTRFEFTPYDAPSEE
jgi:hypothetical protein